MAHEKTLIDAVQGFLNEGTLSYPEDKNAIFAGTMAYHETSEGPVAAMFRDANTKRRFLLVRTHLASDVELVIIDSLTRGAVNRGIPFFKVDSLIDVQSASRIDLKRKDKEHLLDVAKKELFNIERNPVSTISNYDIEKLVISRMSRFQAYADEIDKNHEKTSLESLMAMRAMEAEYNNARQMLQKFGISADPLLDWRGSSTSFSVYEKWRSDYPQLIKRKI